MTVLYAATATPAGDLSGVATLAVIIITVGYFVVCAIWPFRACRHCGGMGRLRGGFGGIRICRRCKGAGLRLRWGRRIWNAVTGLRREVRTDQRRAQQRRRELEGR